MRERFAATASDLVREDERTAVVLAEISRDLFAAAADRAPRRVVNVGIAEQLMIGVTAGLALEGMRPIAHSITPFLVERPYEQIKLDLVMHRLPAVLVSTGGSYDYSTEGWTHHGPADVAVLAALPGVRLAVPGSVSEVDAILRAEHATPEVSYVRLSTRSHQGVPPPGEGLLRVRDGGRGTVLAVGPVLDAVLAATAGLDLGVLYATQVRPFDRAGLRAAVATAAPGRPDPVRVVPIGVPLRVPHHYGTPEDHDRSAGLDAEGIRARLVDL
jgi:transketolase